MRKPQNELTPEGPDRNLWNRVFCLVEWSAAVGFFALLLSSKDIQSVTIATIESILLGAQSLFYLLLFDTRGTVENSVGLLMRVILLNAPGVAFARRTSRKRLIWLLPYQLIVLMLLPASLFAITSTTDWILLSVASITATLAMRAWWLRWLIYAPLITVLFSPAILHHHPTARHSLLSTEELRDHCGRHDGKVISPPIGDATPPSYYAVTPVSPNLALLTGDSADGSWWITRAANGEFKILSASELSGNLWRGCAANERIWLTRNGLFIGVRPPESPNRPEKIWKTPLPDDEVLRQEFDLVGVGCDPTRGRVYFGEVSQGGIWEVGEDEVFRRIEVGGHILLPIPLPNGQLMVSSTSRVQLFNPEDDAIAHTIPSAAASFGVAVCPTDAAIAVADLAGRVRIFERDDAGAYKFKRGFSLAAPRRIAFSPDCSDIAVASGDDRSVWVVDRESARIRCTFEIGPGLRDVAYVDAHTVAAADACGAVMLQCDPEP